MKNDLETYCPQMADPIILFTFQPGLALSIFKIVELFCPSCYLSPPKKRSLTRMERLNEVRIFSGCQFSSLPLVFNRWTS